MFSSCLSLSLTPTPHPFPDSSTYLLSRTASFSGTWHGSLYSAICLPPKAGTANSLIWMTETQVNVLYIQVHCLLVPADVDPIPACQEAGLPKSLFPPPLLLISATSHAPDCLLLKCPGPHQRQNDTINFLLHCLLFPGPESPPAPPNPSVALCVYIPPSPNAHYIHNSYTHKPSPALLLALQPTDFLPCAPFFMLCPPHHAWYTQAITSRFLGKHKK